MTHYRLFIPAFDDKPSDLWPETDASPWEASEPVVAVHEHHEHRQRVARRVRGARVATRYAVLDSEAEELHFFEVPPRPPDAVPLKV